MKNWIFSLVLLIPNRYVYFYTAYCSHKHRQQRVVADCTITYAISTDEGNADKDVTESLKASTKTVYIKGQ
jgi:hypothetical protein